MPEVQEQKQVILSGIQPTGVFTLGNYLGAVQNWVTLQQTYQCAYMIADLHALTVRQEPANLRKQILNAFAILLACGVNPETSLIFIQSHIPKHAELAWVLSCSTQFGELSRMTQFKEKSNKNPQNINAGLFTYPILQAADILLYQADFVPIGADQKQHLEITRDIATRFNHTYGETFTLPQPYFSTVGAKIMSLEHPDKKMSKSDPNPNAYVSILDPPEKIIKKFKRAVTDSDTEIRYADGKHGINNLMTIYAALTGCSFSTIERDFAGQGYGGFKQAVGEAVVEHLAPIRTEYDRLIADRAYLESVYQAGAQKATNIANKTLRKVYKKVGLPI